MRETETNWRLDRLMDRCRELGRAYGAGSGIKESIEGVLNALDCTENVCHPPGETQEQRVAWCNEVERLSAERDRLRGERDEARAFGELAAIRYNALLAGRILTCIYCGHEYPQDTPTSGADVLKAHAEQCEKHPMAAIKAERDALLEALTPSAKTKAAYSDRVHLRDITIPWTTVKAIMAAILARATR